MSTTTNWSLYRPLTAVEQELFQELIGEELGVEALLVATCDDSKKYNEYIFMYNHPDPSTPNLVSFYAKVENKKEKVVEFATAQLTATMATSRLVENDGAEELVIKVAKKMGVKLVDNTLHDNHYLYSQNYYSLNSGTASWASLCKRGELNEYYILTAAHCARTRENKLMHCSGELKLIIDLKMDLFTDSVNNQLRDNRLDAAIYKITSRMPTHFIDNLYHFDGQFELPKATQVRKSFHGITDNFIFLNMNKECKTNDIYSNNFECDVLDNSQVLTGESGGAVFVDNKLTGVLSGHQKNNSKIAIVANGGGTPTCAPRNIAMIFEERELILQ